MRCIFCLLDRPGSEEHVFPRAIGGRLTTYRVCQPCNSDLGSRVDFALSDNFMIKTRRARFGLAGNSGQVPHLAELLLGVSDLAGGQPGKIEAKFNEKTGKLDLRALYHATETALPDGTTVRQIRVDEKDIEQVPTIIQRERKRANLPPLTPSELAAEVEKSTSKIHTIENPSVVIKRSFDVRYPRQALFKIIYELAFMWLGESYLDDPLADELRVAIAAVDDGAAGPRSYIGAPEDTDVFKFWGLNDSSHMAFAEVVRGEIVISVKIFDLFVAMVPVTEHASSYLNSADGANVLRFISVDTASGTVRSSTLAEEHLRLARELFQARRRDSRSRGAE